MSEARRTSRQSRPSSGPSRRGHDTHQTHFFDAGTLRAGATVVDHVTGEQVGTVEAVGRHVFEGYGAPGRGGGPAGDLVVEVRELDPVVPVRLPPATEGQADPPVAPSAEGPAADEPTGSTALPAPVPGKPVLTHGVAIVLAPVLALALLVLVVVLVLS